MYFQTCTTHQSSSFDWLRYGIFPLMSILRVPQSWQLSGVFTDLSFPRVEPFNSLQKGVCLLERCFPALGRFLATAEVVPSTLVCLATKLSSLPAVLWAAGGYWACGKFFSCTSELVRSLGGGPTAAATQVARHGANGACDLSPCNRPHRVCAHEFQNSDSVRRRGNLEIVA